MSAVLHAEGARWRLVGPWYRWSDPAVPDAGRLAPPALQKFAGNDFLARFLERPQHSLRYDEVIDVVQERDLVPAKTAGKLLTTLMPLDAKGEALAKGSGSEAYRARLAPGTLRKLYQPTHDRHYLVTCELHCEEPGFPRVARQKVCQAGFVLRRRRSVWPAHVKPQDIEAQAAIVRRAEADLFELLTLKASADDGTRKDSPKARARLQKLASDAHHADGNALLAARRAALDKLRQDFAAWQSAHGVRVEIEGWFPDPEARTAGPRGEWRKLPAQAQVADVDSGEQTFPLFALVPDPRETGHDAAGRTMYYGVVPTQDLQHDPQGRPHFDDQSTYEVWCFVRAHHPCPPRAGKTPDCNGRVVWSLPTRAFRLAAHFDVLGSANRPITIRMPDLRDLAAQAELRPRGALSPVRFEQPQHLSPVPGAGMGGFSICSFSIPLITIIALFVLNLFLPIVVFLFQLWFLLVFRFCIPPQLSVSLAVDTALAATPPGVDFEADFAVEVANVPRTAADLRKLLSDGLGGQNTLEERMAEEDTRTGDERTAADLSGLSATALARLNQSFADQLELKPQGGVVPRPPEPGEPLRYEDPVQRNWPKGSPA